MRWKDAFKRACWVSMEFSIHRYLMANTFGRLDGGEKARVHRDMCQLMERCFSVFGRYDDLHSKTQRLTGYMDEKIGFPLEKQYPDYDKLAGLFFDEFFKITEKVLTKESK